jgi:membrane protease YdiL (CAAX protease family)
MGETDRFGIVRGAAPTAPAAPVVPPQELPGTPDRFGIVHSSAAAYAGTPSAETAEPASHSPVATLAPPTRWQPPELPDPASWRSDEPARTGTLGAWGWGSTGYTVIGAIALGGLLQLLFLHLGRNPNYEPEKLVRYEIVALVAFYGIVAAIVIQRLTAGRVRLFWTDGKPLQGALIGGGIGLTLGLVLLGINSAINGHLSTDPGVTLMTSEGDVAHICAAILLTMIAAPLVEETLFRGLLAESLRSSSKAKAVWVSAIAFALWHWRPEALRYYALMGAMFALLYWKRGLVCSMATHACFNGVLTVAAIVLALTPGQTIHGAGFQFSAARGWHVDSKLVDEPNAVHLLGPSGSDVLVAVQPTGGVAPSADTLLGRFNSGALASFGGFDTTMGSPHKEQLPAGPAVVADVTYQGHRGEVVLIPAAGEVVVVGFGSGGSAKAERDFAQMLQTLQIS